ncbi:MAG: DNA primase [Proteobacteria bacterium]|nr:DNA primase [Pseudomonadota bacterium]
MRSTLEELLNRVNIVDVVSQHVKLRKSGKDFIGLCPFHSEKTPSFTVSIEKQIYYCFGCHEGGNLINFMMKFENMTFQETLENLAHEYGVEIKKGGTKRSNSFDAMLKLADFYHHNIKNTRSPREYLAGRGITSDVIDEFKIGYSDRSRHVIQTFIKNAGIPRDILLNTGILRIKDNDIYDIFMGRIVIPIFDVNKKVIGFGGRTIEKDGFPKYINSPESPIFSKGASLFGIDKTRKYITEKNEVFIVEGYFDFIALYTAGLKNVVSTLGTSVTEVQLTRLRNYTENITLMLDGDEAGIKSALKLIGRLSDMEINGSMVVLPDGNDPDSFIKKEGIDGLNKVIDTKKPILDYYFDYCMAKWGVGTLENKNQFIKSVLPYIEGIRSGVKKRLYIKRLSELTGVEEYHFGEGLKEKATEQLSGNHISSSIIERRVIGALIGKPGMLGIFKEKEVINYIKDAEIKEILLNMCEFFDEKGDMEVNNFINVLGKDSLRDLVTNAVFDVAGYEENELEKVLLDYFRHVENKSIKVKAKKITERLLEAEKRGDEKEIMELLNEKQKVLAFFKTNQ